MLKFFMCFICALSSGTKISLPADRVYMFKVSVLSSLATNVSPRLSPQKEAVFGLPRTHDSAGT